MELGEQDGYYPTKCIEKVDIIDCCDLKSLIVGKNLLLIRLIGPWNSYQNLANLQELMYIS